MTRRRCVRIAKRAHRDRLARRALIVRLRRPRGWYYLTHDQLRALADPWPDEGVVGASGENTSSTRSD